VRRYSLRPRGAARPEAAPETKGSAPGAASPDYEIGMALEFVALTGEVERMDYVLAGPAALAREDARNDFRAAVAGAWTDKSIEVQSVAGAKLEKESGEATGPAKISLAGPKVAWAGEAEKYFAVVIIPQKPSREGTFAAGAEAFRYEVTEFGQPMPMAGVRLVAREQAVSTREPLRHEYVIYAGPKDPTVLESYASIGLPEMIVWKPNCCPIPGIGEISRFLIVVLETFRAVVGNYGLAIVMLVVVLRLVLHPVTRWSSKSMAKMQKLAPKMQTLREKHKDDKEGLNAAMTRLYGEEGLMRAQLGGCLPMFLQMPIWIALYSALGVAISLRHAYFIPPSWLPADSIVSMFLQDLSVPDRFLQWTTPYYLPGRDMPIIGTWVVGGIQRLLAGGEGGIVNFNILPILVGVSMYLQQKMTPQAPAAGPQADQQRKMMNLMSVVFALMLYSLPSGLCLYISVSSFLGFFEQRYLKKKFAAAAEAAQSGEPSAPKPPKKAGSLVAGRNKSIAERIEAWLHKRHGQPERDEGDRTRKTK
jgi:YidC/Oxa1 family membrane protein insertase